MKKVIAVGAILLAVAGCSVKQNNAVPWSNEPIAGITGPNQTADHNGPEVVLSLEGVDYLVFESFVVMNITDQYAWATLKAAYSDALVTNRTITFVK